ncbi:MAG: hypothetical protein WA718_06140 [Terriglobales bacterium]
MSISGIFSHINNSQQIAASNPAQQFQQLGQALQTGNLSAAQSDFASLQAAFSAPATTTGSATSSASSDTAVSSSTTSSPVNQAFNQLASDLQSGNLSAAQKDFSTVQQDLNGQNLAGPTNASGSHSHHHGHPIKAGSGDPESQNSLLQDLNQIGQNLSSSNLAGAQQAYSTLQQQMQQFALGGASLSSLSPVSFDA